MDCRADQRVAGKLPTLGRLLRPLMILGSFFHIARFMIV
jgi:hypothetical protein